MRSMDKAECYLVCFSTNNQRRAAVPVSSVVSALLIWVAFNVDNAKEVWKWFTARRFNFKHASEPKTTPRVKEGGDLEAYQ